MGSFAILDMDSVEIIRAGQYYSARQTNNNAKHFALWNALQCLNKLVQDWLVLRYPIWVFRNIQLIICFLMHVFKWPHHHSIY